MGIYSDKLPQMGDKIFITAGGLETVLLFHHNLDLPEFAAYDLLRDERGYEILFDYYRTYAELARIKVADTPTHAYPVVSGNRLFVKDQESVILYTVQ